jgi:hypothetical protein
LIALRKALRKCRMENDILKQATLIMGAKITILKTKFFIILVSLIYKESTLSRRLGGNIINFDNDKFQFWIDVVHFSAFCNPKYSGLSKLFSLGTPFLVFVNLRNCQ